MTLSRRRDLAISLSLLLLGAELGRPSVLCLGMDGHVSIEVSGAPCCGPEVSNGNNSGTPLPPRWSAITANTGESCGSCTDIPLFTNTLLTLGSREQPAKLWPQAAAWFTPELACQIGPCTAPRLFGSSFEVPAGTLTRLRTVILRR